MTKKARNPNQQPLGSANVNFDPASTDNVTKIAEDFNDKVQDQKDEMKEGAEKIKDDTPTTPEELINKKGFSAWQAAEKVKAKRREEHDQKKFQIDLDKYMHFCDMTCSEPSKDRAQYLDRLNQLYDQGCNVSLLDTASQGLTAEAGEFCEIVKKIKYQGKPYNDANKEHLVKELGDILWYASQAARALDIRLDEVFYANTLKLATRYPSGEFNIEDSENRKPGDI